MNMSPLSTGIYTITQAAALVGVHPSRLRGWVRGRNGAKGHPLIPSELPALDHKIALSFVNLIEAKFIATFAQAGVSVLSIRFMAEEAERFLGHPHPFATDMMFRTDGRKIFIEAARATNAPRLYDLKGKNWAIHSVLSEALRKDLEFSAKGLVQAWIPRKDIAPEVRVTPKVAFGQPALESSGIPTEALYLAYKADGDDAASVARWFGVTEREVQQAVRFETEVKH